MEVNDIIVEELRRVNSTLDNHGDKLEQLLLIPYQMEKRFIKKPSLISVSLIIGIIGTVISITLASISH